MGTGFLLYIKDLPHALSGKTPVLFAVVTSLTVSSKKYEEICSSLDESSNKSGQWFLSNGLLLNEPKSQLMHFCTRYNVTPHLTDLNLPTASSVKFHDVVVNYNFKWKHHSDYLVPQQSYS